ncbi:prepilin-type N-terminal cleavage/methylation domain-containing protein [Roseateles koreensis]|uniref:Prepilin-type N-terminal cleavage/methylation domain-containing protein n=1 Tax=Roseateles koreensis TaxID=2987526 RepID=A0ABT5KNG4_9BURK|nr:prepilin-type N-terminal cleavage/methylation domain-containing protein [Roseateles koreensis]MDC8784455.1 prepilin-type N-terminal cleavage/methylation domain-containing protein [Roseateles koreensis]
MRAPSRHASRFGAVRRSAGFTLIELVMVIVLIGTLAIFALPKLIDTTMWRLVAFGDDLQSQMQAMLRLSLVQRRPIIATLSTTGVSFAYASGAAIDSMACPVTASPCIAEAGPRTVVFNANNSGTSLTSTGTAMPVTVSYGSYTQAYVAETDSGLFRRGP